MFDSKKKQLFEVEKKTSVMTKDPFLRGAIATDTILSENGSEKLKSTGTDFVDQFASASKYRTPREYSEISKDMETLWSQNPLLTLKLLVYFRLITRVCRFPDSTSTKTTQRGQGLKHESIMRMLWLIVNHPEVFIKNVTVFISAGSWKDLITMMQYDAMYNGEDHSFDWRILIEVIAKGLENPNTSHLVRKYLPTIRAKSKCKTVEAQADNLVAKAICRQLFGSKSSEKSGHTYKLYRKLKAQGEAHEWQQAISQRAFTSINFDTIPGKALQLLVNSKFLENQGLEVKYEEWLANKPVAKYTGYVYELFSPFENKNSYDVKEYQKNTVNAQFKQLIAVASKDMKEGENGLICVLDSSGSMSGTLTGTNTSAYTIAKTMTLFFSELLKGRFHNHYFEFSSATEHRQFKGSTPWEKYHSNNSRITANTNFVSVADKFVQILKTGVMEEEFPSGMLCLSDGEFDNPYSNNNNKAVAAFRETLLKGGFSKKFVNDFKIILWDIPNGYYGKSTPKFEELADSPNTIHIGGLDGSIVTFLLGNEISHKAPSTSEELFEAAMGQEILAYLNI